MHSSTSDFVYARATFLKSLFSTSSAIDSSSSLCRKFGLSTALNLAIMATTALPRVSEGLSRYQRRLSLDYLRTTLTLLVIAAHSIGAYVTGVRRVFPNNLIPVLDQQRHAAFTSFLHFNDNFLIALMFFLSGLFFWPALQRHGASNLLRGRLLRLGLPFAVFSGCILPLAYYPSWKLAGHHDSFFAYLPHHYREMGWPVGPPWFIWLLLLFDFAATAACLAAPRLVERGARRLERVIASPAAAFITLCGITLVLYVPMVLHSGSESWRTFFVAPLWFQTSRLFLDFAWFSAGIVLGMRGIDRSFLAEDGALARRWPLWAVAGCVCFTALECVRNSQTAQWLALSGHKSDILQAIAWALSCTVVSFAFLAFFQARAYRRFSWMDSLTRSAYVLYLAHYVFVTWIQYWLLSVSLPVAVKAAVVFAGATLLSWITAQLLLRIPGVSKVV
jgi:glucan biosynthesis protein C